MVETAYDVLLCPIEYVQRHSDRLDRSTESGDPHPCLVILCHHLPFPLHPAGSGTQEKNKEYKSPRFHTHVLTAPSSGLDVDVERNASYTALRALRFRARTHHNRAQADPTKTSTSQQKQLCCGARPWVHPTTNTVLSVSLQASHTRAAEYRRGKSALPAVSCGDQRGRQVFEV